MKGILTVTTFILLGFLSLMIRVPGFRFRNSPPIVETEENLLLVKNLKDHVYKLSHEIGVRSVYYYDNLNKAADYISCQFNSFGLDVKFQEYVVSNKRVKNIYATKLGNKHPDKILIIGAHYDTFFNPGADDNASAVSGVLELARSLVNVETDLSIIFIAFVNEEPPFFRTAKMGSRVYAKAAKKRGDNIIAAIVLEMIGYYTDEKNKQKYPWVLAPFYPNRGDFVAVVGNLRSRNFIKKLVAVFKGRTDFPIESTYLGDFILGAGFSDHWSFWKEGYPAVMVTDTAFYRNPNYHSRRDTYDTLDYERMAEVVCGLKAVLVDLAN